MAVLSLPLGSYRLPAPAASTRRLVNCYAEQAPAEAPRGQPAMLVRAPGIASFVDTGAAEVRGLIVMGANLYACAGSNLFKVTEAGAVTALSGASISGNGPVRMATNGTSIIVAPGLPGNAWSSDGATVVEVTDGTFLDGGGGLDPVFVDGYLVCRKPSSARFFNSGLNALTWNALDIATAEGAPDNLVGLTVNNRELILPGEVTTERWYNAGQSPGSPFARSPQGLYEIGCAAGGSLASQDNSVLMLANDFTIRRLGATWERVSQHAIEAILQRMSVRSDCYALAYRQEGHHFVAFTFPSEGRTLVIDLNTMEWHERESRIDTVSIGRWRPSCITQAWGKQIVGDSESGKLGILDPDTHTEWGEPQVMSWTYPSVYAEGLRAMHRRLEIGLAAGQGLTSGQGSNPLITLHVSDDGGNTWRARPTRETGKIGEYRKRVQWFNLGAARDRAYRCEMSDPVRTLVLDTQVDAIGARA
ncbi:MAG: hypothetical protein IT480_06495 [Gammaproteobacteria bacterium]|nr:hypothetical protein [Gammaproteobacteria bacterium]